MRAESTHGAPASCLDTFQTDDVDEYTSVLAQWRVRSNQVSLGRFHGRVDRLALPGLRLYRKRTNRKLLETVEGPPDSISVALPLFQDGDLYNGGNIQRPGQACFLNGGGRLTMRSSEQLDLVAVCLDRETMLAVLRETDPLAAARVERMAVETLVVDSEANRELARLLLACLEGAPALPAWLSDEASQAACLRQVSLLVGAALCGEPAGARCGRVRPSRQQLIDRAIRLLDQSMFEPMRVSAICKELSADRRTLQNAFQEVLGESPNAFFKNVRLNRAHHDLKRPSQRDFSVCDVAMRYGFWHLSQFARDYQRAFGELPTETRRRAREF